MIFEPLTREFGGYIFDCDGTLADSMVVHHRAWLSALREHGATFDFHWDLFVSRAGMSLPNTVEELNVQFGLRLDPDVYYVDRLPISADLTDFILVALSALVITTLATVYPAVAASRLRPVEGIRYGSVQASLDRQQGDNAWLTMALTEGKNREIRKLCGHFGWAVSRLIRLSYGPFQLGNLESGAVEEVKGKVLKDQLGIETPKDKPKPDKPKPAGPKPAPAPAAKPARKHHADRRRS